MTRRFAACALALLGPVGLAGCLSDEALRIECGSDAECAVDEACVARTCQSRAALEALEASGACVGPQCVPCDDCTPAPNQVAVCEAGTCVRECTPGFLDLDPLAPGCEYGCVPTTDPLERCDGVDNDCDGATDENDDALVSSPCAEQLGVCDGSVRACVDGIEPGCDAQRLADEASGPYEPGQETRCDGADNDCDGDVDERCCGEADPREVLSRAAGWEALGVVGVEGAGLVLHALHRDGQGGRGAWATWAVGAGDESRARETGSFPLCAATERAMTGAIDVDGSVLAVVCAEGIDAVRAVMFAPGETEPLGAVALPRVPWRVRAARLGATVAAAVEYRDGVGGPAGAARVRLDARDGTGEVIDVGVGDDVTSVDVLAAGGGFWLGAIVAGAPMLERYVGDFGASAASGTLDGGAQAMALVPLGELAGVVELRDGALHRGVARVAGARVEVAARGAPLELVMGADDRVATASLAAGTLVVVLGDGGIDARLLGDQLARVDAVWAGTEGAEMPEVGTTFVADGGLLLAATGRVEGLGDALALLRLGAELSAICPLPSR